MALTNTITLTQLSSSGFFNISTNKIVEVFDIDGGARVFYLNDFTAIATIDVEEDAATISTDAGNLVEVTDATTGETKYLNFANVITFNADAVYYYSIMRYQRNGSAIDTITVTQSPNTLDTAINAIAW